MQSKKGEIKKRLCKIELVNHIKYSKNFYKYFSNKNKSSIDPLHEEGDIITTDIEIEEILNKHFGTAFTSENLNNVPEFNLSYGKKIEASKNIFQNK